MQEIWTIGRLLKWTVQYFTQKGIESPRLDAEVLLARVLGRLLAASPLAGQVKLLPVENAFFGGNVDVTCLLVGEDIVRALRRARPRGPVIISKQTLNADGVLLDDMTVERLEQLSGCSIELCTYSVNELLAALG